MTKKNIEYGEKVNSGFKISPCLLIFARMIAISITTNNNQIWTKKVQKCSVSTKAMYTQ